MGRMYDGRSNAGFDSFKKAKFCHYLRRFLIECVMQQGSDFLVPWQENMIRDGAVMAPRTTSLLSSQRSLSLVTP